MLDYITSPVQGNLKLEATPTTILGPYSIYINVLIDICAFWPIWQYREISAKNLKNLFLSVKKGKKVVWQLLNTYNFFPNIKLLSWLVVKILIIINFFSY